MLNHSARVYLPVFQDQLRTSVLGRAIGPKVRTFHQSDAATEDEARRSPATNVQIRKFLDAWHAGDGATQSDALNNIVRTWRADNAAGGVPVHAHLALPKDFAKMLVERVGEPNRLVPGLLTEGLDVGVRAMVAQQLTEIAERGDVAPAEYRLPDLANAKAEHAQERIPTEANEKSAEHFLERFGRDHVDRATSQEVLGDFGGFARSDPLRRALAGLNASGDHTSREAERVMGRKARDLQSGTRLLPWDGERGRTQSLQGSPYGPMGPMPWEKSAPKQDEDPEPDWFGPIDDSYEGPDLRRDADDPLPPPTIFSRTDPVAPEFQPGAWRARREARSHLGKLLVDPRDLTERQRRNLFGRKWMNPTGNCAGNKRLRDGYGYFGAGRSDGTYHGALDFPGDDVQMPTDARLLEIRNAGKEGHTLIFDLGDGMQLAMHHVKPSAELLRYWRSLQGLEAYSRGGTIRAGALLGKVDKTARDHVHLQISGIGGTLNGVRLTRRLENGQIVETKQGGFVVDPTMLFGC
jgi:hypothetical protein